MVKVGIVGGTGYTGAELLRLLSMHPNVQLQMITSRTEVGRPVADLFPGLRGNLDLKFSLPNKSDLSTCDLIFFATPNGVAMKYVSELLSSGVRIIDLAADFRLSDAHVWKQWYGLEHACPDVLEQAIYGLPEMSRLDIVKAKLIANPGCYPTATQLGLLPLIKNGLVSGNIIVDAKSGVSGAGRGAHVNTLLCEASESIKAYGVPGHRHLPEIKQGIERMGANDMVGDLIFVPHLTPMIRGIHSTIYCTVNDHSVNLQELYENIYESEPFVDVMPAGSHPETRSVRNCNKCRIAVHRPQKGDVVVVLSVIDNLTKGASGQAIQNMNIMFSLDEKTGLDFPATMP